jgi:hypothetical protein
MDLTVFGQYGLAGAVIILLVYLLDRAEKKVYTERERIDKMFAQMLDIQTAAAAAQNEVAAALDKLTSALDLEEKLNAALREKAM